VVDQRPKGALLATLDSAKVRILVAEDS
jgi:hypothetical protein